MVATPLYWKFAERPRNLFVSILCGSLAKPLNHKQFFVAPIIDPESVILVWFDGREKVFYAHHIYLVGRSINENFDSAVLVLLCFRIEDDTVKADGVGVAFLFEEVFCFVRCKMGVQTAFYSLPEFRLWKPLRGPTPSVLRVWSCVIYGLRLRRKWIHFCIVLSRFILLRWVCRWICRRWSSRKLLRALRGRLWRFCWLSLLWCWSTQTVFWGLPFCRCWCRGLFFGLFGLFAGFLPSFHLFWMALNNHRIWERKKERYKGFCRFVGLFPV